MTTEKQLEQTREIVKLLEKKYNTNGYVGVEVDSPFDNLARYTEDYTIVDCIFQNILDEISALTQALSYDEDDLDITAVEANRHIKKLKKFVKDNTEKYFVGAKVHEYLKIAEK